MAPSKRLPQHKLSVGENPTLAKNGWIEGDEKGLAHNSIKSSSIKSSSIKRSSNAGLSSRAEPFEVEPDGLDPLLSNANSNANNSATTSISMSTSTSMIRRKIFLAILNAMDGLRGSSRRPIRRRQTMGLVTILAMSSVSFGIVAAIYQSLAPLNTPKALVVDVSADTVNRQDVYDPSTTTTTTTTITTITNQSPTVAKELEFEFELEPAFANYYYYNHYEPSSIERFVLDNSGRLGLDRAIVGPSIVTNGVDDDSTLTALYKIPPPLLPITLVARLAGGRGNQERRRPDYDNPETVKGLPSGCDLWIPETAASAMVPPDVFQQFHHYRNALETYGKLLETWRWTWQTNNNNDNNNNQNNDDQNKIPKPSMGKPSKTPDLREYLSEQQQEKGGDDDGDGDGDAKHNVCASLEVHSLGLANVLGEASLLSKLSRKTRKDAPGSPSGSGVSTKSNNQDHGQLIYVEPILPPLRHPNSCFGGLTKKEALFDRGYLVHDFAALCRHGLRKHGRTILVDVSGRDQMLSESLSESSSESSASSLSLSWLLELYQRFGFVFDDVHEYEVAADREDPSVASVRRKHASGSHVASASASESESASASSPTPEDADDAYYPLLHPLEALVADKYTPDDFVVVRIAPETAGTRLSFNNNATTEQLVERLLGDSELAAIVDVLYLGYPVTMRELAPVYRDAMAHRSIQDAIDLLTGLRKRGIAAHYWFE